MEIALDDVYYQYMQHPAACAPASLAGTCLADWSLVSCIADGERELKAAPQIPVPLCPSHTAGSAESQRVSNMGSAAACKLRSRSVTLLSSCQPKQPGPITLVGCRTSHQALPCPGAYSFSRQTASWRPQRTSCPVHQAAMSCVHIAKSTDGCNECFMAKQQLSMQDALPCKAHDGESAPMEDSTITRAN